MAVTDLSALQRASGAYAMLAVDQREALRTMLAQQRSDAVTDEEVRDFKLTAARALTPYASGVLIDRQFAWEAAIEHQVTAPDCGLIAAADQFEPAHGELVGEVTIDRQVDPAQYKAAGAVALKLLVLYRPDQDPAGRVSMVEEFVRMCCEHELISIIEPVSRAPVGGGDYDWEAGVLAAATELGSLGADLYKAEVPTRGQGPDAEIRRRCAALSETIDGPWVVLSSGVPAERFADAVRLACLEGAQGFLAGRAVWAGCIGADDMGHCLSGAAVRRLQRLCEVVDEVVA